MSSSLIASLFLVLTAPAVDIETRQGALAFVGMLQNEDGGFRPTLKEGPSSLRATLAAVRACKYFSGKVGRKEAAIKFVASCYDPAIGAFSDTPMGKTDIIPTAVGLMVVVDLGMPLQPYADASVRYLDTNAKSFEEVRLAAAALEGLGRKAVRVDAWIDVVKKMSKPDGTFGDGKARDTGSAVVTLLRLGQTVEQRDAVLTAMNAGQKDSGGFGKTNDDKADLETTYRVMRAYHMLKAKPAKVDALKAYLTRCRNTDGGFGVAPGEPSSASGTYYVSIILRWLEEK